MATPGLPGGFIIYQGHLLPPKRTPMCSEGFSPSSAQKSLRRKAATGSGSQPGASGGAEGCRIPKPAAPKTPWAQTSTFCLGIYGMRRTNGLRREMEFAAIRSWGLQDTDVRQAEVLGGFLWFFGLPELEPGRQAARFRCGVLFFSFPGMQAPRLGPPPARILRNWSDVAPKIRLRKVLVR